MRLEAYDNRGNTVNREITRAVIYDDFDNPILIGMKCASGVCYVTRIGDKEFDTAIRLMGIDKTVVVETIAGPNDEKTGRLALP